MPLYGQGRSGAFTYALGADVAARKGRVREKQGAVTPRDQEAINKTKVNKLPVWIRNRFTEKQ